MNEKAAFTLFEKMKQMKSIEPLLLHTIKNLTLHKLLFTNLYEYPVILNYNHAL